MTNHLEDIKLNFNFVDSKLVSCSQPETGDLFIRIRTKNFEYVDFIFKHVILFIEWGNGGSLSKFCLNKFPTDLFLLAIKKAYKFDSIPSRPQEQLFQFLDSTSEPSIEIVCIDFDYRVGPRSR